MTGVRFIDTLKTHPCGDVFLLSILKKAPHRLRRVLTGEGRIIGRAG